MDKTYCSQEDLSILQSQILALKNYISSLLKRLSLIKINYSQKNNFEKNEIDIQIYDTKALISSSTFRLKNLEEKYQSKLNDYYEKKEEVLKEFDALVQTVTNSFQNNLEIKHFLYPINWKIINEDFDAKMNLYFALKDLVSKQVKT